MAITDTMKPMVRKIYRQWFGFFKDHAIAKRQTLTEIRLIYAMKGVVL